MDSSDLIELLLDQLPKKQNYNNLNDNNNNNNDDTCNDKEKSSYFNVMNKLEVNGLDEETIKNNAYLNEEENFTNIPSTETTTTTSISTTSATMPSTTTATTMEASTNEKKKGLYKIIDWYNASSSPSSKLSTSNDESNDDILDSETKLNEVLTQYLNFSDFLDLFTMISKKKMFIFQTSNNNNDDSASDVKESEGGKETQLMCFHHLLTHIEDQLLT